MLMPAVAVFFKEEQCLVLQYALKKIPIAAVKVDMFQGPTFASHIICHSIWPDASLKNSFPMASRGTFHYIPTDY